MTDARLDPETLAALIDGRLTGAERERALSVLARSEEAYEDFLEATALLDELPPGLDVPPPGTDGKPAPELRLGHSTGAPAVDRVPPEPAPPPPTPPDAIARRRRRRRLGLALPLLAAGIAVVLVLPRVRSSGPDPLLAARVVGAGGAPGGMARTFGPDWNQPGWSAVRGDGDALSPRARAFRMGVRAAELELAYAARDSAAVAGVAASLERLAAGADVAGGAAAAALRGLAARGLSSSAEERDRVAALLRALAEPPELFDLGAWSEAARLAARAGRGEVFARDGDAMRELRRALEAADARRLSGEAAVERVRALSASPPGTAAEVAAAAALDSVVAAGGR